MSDGLTTLMTMVGAQLDWAKEWLDELMGKDEIQSQKSAAVKDQRVLNGIQAQTMLIKSGGPFWRALLNWGKAKQLLSPKEEGILQTASAIPAKIPSEMQAMATLAILGRLQTEGCQLGLQNG